MTVKEELREYLKTVKDFYEDFEHAGAGLKNDNDRRVVIDYIKSDPDATTSDVLEKITELMGIKPVA